MLIKLYGFIFGILNAGILLILKQVGMVLITQRTKYSHL